MKYLSLFSGIGGFEKAIEEAYKETQKVLQENKNCDNIGICKKHAQNVKSKNLSQSIITQPQTLSGVKNVQEKMQEKGQERIQKNIEKPVGNVEKKTERNIIEREENTQDKGDRTCLKCMEENVLVAESQKKNSLHLNTEMEMDTKTEKNTEQDICINSHSKKIINQSTKYSAITATTPKVDMVSAHICVGYSEIDKYAIQVYEKHFNHANLGDITKIKEKTLPDFDLLVGGFSCQPFSIAGKRKGFEDLRGQVVFDIIRILRAKKPKMFLLENVKGLLSHNGGTTMEIICEELCESGYALDFEVLNSKNFGVPQNRERVFIIGKRLDTLPSNAIY